MTDNKADKALKEVENIKLKVYYTGDTPAESGVLELGYQFLDPIDKNHSPWLFKFYPNGENMGCSQFVNSFVIYQKLSKGLAKILDAVIVNTKQREAIDKLIDHLLWGELGHDAAYENDGIAQVENV